MSYGEEDDEIKIKIFQEMTQYRILMKNTELNDALRKHGILPPREENPPTPSPPPPSPKLQNILEQASASELQELEDEAADSETERAISAYRRQRLAELSRLNAQPNSAVSTLSVAKIIPEK